MTRYSTQALVRLALVFAVMIAFVTARPVNSLASADPTRVLLVVRLGLDRAGVERLAARHGAQVERWLPRLGLALLRTDASPADRLVADLESEPDVVAAGPDAPTAHAADIPGDEHWAEQWGMVKVAAPAGWDLAWGQAGDPIAIVDSGVQYLHADLRDQMWYNPGESALDAATGLRNCNTPLASNGVDDDQNGYVDDCRGFDFVDFDNDPRDLFGHGTVVAGIAAAATNNPDPYVPGGFEGVAGMARQAKIMALRGLNAGGTGTGFNLAEAIAYAAENGARVINLSFTFDPQTSPDSPHVLAVQRAVADAQAAGALVVAAAGNEAYNGIDYPAKLPGVLAVGASTPNDQRATAFSNYGARLDLLAPGVNIYTPLMSTGNFNYGYYNGTGNGTSFAAPHVAGVAALVRGLRPDLGQADVYALLRRTADDLGATGFDPQTGWGRLNAARALAEALVGLSLELKTDPPGAAWGAPVTLRARVRGPGGVVAGAGARITFTTTGGTLAPATATADATGEAKATLTTPGVSGVLTVGAQLGNLSATIPVTVSSGIPAAIALHPSPAVVGLGGQSDVLADVRDDGGNAVKDGVSVTFQASQGVVSPATTTTTGGHAQTRFTAPTAPGPVTVEALAGGVNGAATITVVGAGTPLSMTLTAAPLTAEVDGAPITLSARVWDGAGALAPNGAAVTFATDLGTLDAVQALTVNGVATVQLRPGSQAGLAHVTATAGYATGRVDVTILAGLAATVSVDAAPATLVAGYNQISQITATPLDRNGNPVPDGAMMTFTTTLGQVVPSSVAVVAGQAETQLIGGLVAGQAQVTATAPGDAAGGVTVTITPAAPAQLAFEAQPLEILIGGDTARLKATVRDAYGNAVTDGLLVNFTTDRGGLRAVGSVGTLLNALAMGTVGGVAQVELVSEHEPGTANVRAEVSGLPPQGVQVEMQPGAPATLTLQLQPSVVRPGGRMDIVALVADQKGNPVADGTTVSFAASRGVVDHAAVQTEGGVAYTGMTAALEPGPFQIVAISGAASSFKTAAVASSTLWLPVIRR